MIQLDNCIKFFSKLILKELSAECSVWVAGGCVRDYFSVGKLTSDIDLIFPSQEDFEKCKNYLLEATKMIIKEKDGDVDIIKEIPKPKAKKIFENDNVLKVIYRGRQFDIIKKYYQTPGLTIAEFDFTVCCAAVDLSKVYTHETFFIDLAKRQLMINKLPYPLSTMWRVQKYIQRGFYMCSGEMLKLAKSIGELQINKPENESANLELQPISEGGLPIFLTFD